MLNRAFAFLLLWMVCLCAPAQIVNENKAFEVGEEMVLDAYFNVQFIWVKVGTATFKVSEENDNYVFTVTAANMPKWDWLYEVRTKHVASCTKDMKPLYMWNKVHEKGKYSEDTYHYKDLGDHYEISRHTKSEKYPNGHDTVYGMPYEVHDIINSVYVARNTDLTVNEGKMIPFYPLFSNHIHIMFGNVVGKEEIETREGETYSCLKCTAVVGKGTIIDDTEPVVVYVTDDNRKIPILVEAKLSFGYIKVYLKSFKAK